MTKGEASTYTFSVELPRLIKQFFGIYHAALPIYCASDSKVQGRACQLHFGYRSNEDGW
jgi:hypothetical protein